MLIMMKKSAISNFFITLIAIDNYLYVYKINIDSLFLKFIYKKQCGDICHHTCFRSGQ